MEVDDSDKPAAASQGGEASTLQPPAGPDADDDDDYESHGSDEDEAPPDFYDSDADEEDEEFVMKQRKGRDTDAVLSCPCCLQTLCMDCQQHAQYKDQYRAVFVINCRVDPSQRLRPAAPSKDRAKGAAEESYTPVTCAECRTEVGVCDQDEVYHFFHVIAS